MYLLEVIHGPDAGKRFTLPEREPQLIGRSTEAIPITDDSVSRRHAELTPDDDRWWLRDLDSTNGTYVNDSPVHDRTVVKAGDRIRCGDTIFAMVREHEILHEPLEIEPQTNSGNIDFVEIPRDEESQMAILASIIEDINLSNATAPNLDEITSELCRRFGADRATVVPLKRSQDHEGFEILNTPLGKISPQTTDIPQELLQRATSRQHLQQARIQKDTTHLMACTPILDQGEVLGVLILERDSDTPWNHEESAMLEAVGRVLGIEIGAAERAEATNRNRRLAAMGEAVAALSHSIKNILQGLRGGADAVELAITREDIGMAKSGWPILARNLDRILSLTLNMLAYSKDRGLEMDPIQLGTLAGEVRDLLRSKAARKGVSVTLEPDPHEPPVLLDADAIHQALLNLLDNAIEAAPEKTGQVLIKTEYDSTKGVILAHVSDNGPGIPLANQERVFEPFVSSKGQRGTGLGLSVSRKLIRQHGGKLEISSSPAGGCSLLMELPVNRTNELDSAKTRGAPLPLADGDLGVEFSEE